MKAKELYAFVGIAATLGIMVGMSTVAYTRTAVADKGGVPNDSARSGPACENAQERHERFFDRDDGSSRGTSQSHISTFHNDRGLESVLDSQPER